MSDLRYHALTLIGVFLALAVGLMMGSALGSPDKLAGAYESIRGQFELLRAENQRVKEENDTVRRRLAAREKAIRELLPQTVRGRLAGSRVGVVICGSLDERGFWNDLEGTLRLAGAEIGPVVRVPDRLRALSPEARSRLGHVWEGQTLPPAAAAFEAAGWIVRGLVRADAPQKLEELARAAGIDVRGDLRQPVRRFLVLTGVPDEARQAALTAGDVPDGSVVDAARAERVRVVAAEPEEGLASAVEALRSHGVPTVDDIDTPSGQLSAVLALAGAEGQFGSKPGATRPIPPLPAGPEAGPPP